MHSHHQRLPTAHLDRPVHLWTFGSSGTPILVFPSAAGMAHEWQASGAVEALRPWIEAGRITLFCPESNVSVAWTGDRDPSWRLDQHRAYERFIREELIPHAQQTVGQENRVFAAGCSFGGFYAANLALKNPDAVSGALCLSGRYRTEAFLHGFYDERVYFADPLHYVPNLSGDGLDQVRTVHLTLVVGRGNFEGRCIRETRDLAHVLREKGIPHHEDLWGTDVSHHWDWWRRQLVFHITKRFGRP